AALRVRAALAVGLDRLFRLGPRGKLDRIGAVAHIPRGLLRRLVVGGEALALAVGGVLALLGARAPARVRRRALPARTATTRVVLLVVGALVARIVAAVDVGVDPLQQLEGRDRGRVDAARRRRRRVLPHHVAVASDPLALDQDRERPQLEVALALGLVGDD